MSRTVGEFERRSFAQRVYSDVFEGRPHLQHVNPAIIEKAAAVVGQYNLQRGVTAYTKQTANEIASLVETYIGQMRQPTAPTAPVYAAPPMPVAPTYAAPPAPVAPTQPMFVQVQGPNGPYFAPVSAGSFGVPVTPAPTPEAEFGWFMQNGQ
jgi:hypothetical protein